MSQRKPLSLAQRRQQRYQKRLRAASKEHVTASSSGVAQPPAGVFAPKKRSTAHKACLRASQARRTPPPESLKRSLERVRFSGKRVLKPSSGRPVFVKRQGKRTSFSRKNQHQRKEQGLLRRAFLVLGLLVLFGFGVFQGLCWGGEQLALALGWVSPTTSFTATSTAFTPLLPVLETPWGAVVSELPVQNQWPRKGQLQPRLLPLPLSAEASSLQQRFEAIAATASEGFVSHVYFLDPQQGVFAGLNAEQAVPAASVIKLPILLSALQAHEEGLLNLDSQRVLDASNRAAGSGQWYGDPDGTSYSMERALATMIEISDNTATNMVVQQLGGLPATQQQLAGFGLPATMVHDWLPDLTGLNTISMKDSARLLFNLQEGALLTGETRVKALEILMSTKNSSLIPDPLPKDVVVAHKTGNIGASLGDSALLFLPDGRYYYLCIQIERPHNAAAARGLIHEYSKAAYAFMQESASF